MLIVPRALSWMASPEQAKALDMALGESGKAIDKVSYISVATDELVRRLSGRSICRNCQTPYNEVSSPPKVAGICDLCGGELYKRSDDLPQTVRKRIEIYLNETAPLIDYYREEARLVEIEGEGEIEEISKRLIGALSHD
jgi:adenylate kinase